MTPWQTLSTSALLVLTAVLAVALIGWLYFSSRSNK